MGKLITRICYNSNGWIRPSGDVADRETDSKNIETKYGHEEWLFNGRFLIDSFQYSFLQGFANGGGVEGKTFDVYLYMLDGKGSRFWIGKIEKCRILTPSEAKKDIQEFKNAGYLEEMRNDIATINGDISFIDRKFDNPEDIINIRFLPGNAHRLDQPKYIDSKSRIYKFDHYNVHSEDKVEPFLHYFEE